VELLDSFEQALGIGSSFAQGGHGEDRILLGGVAAEAGVGAIAGVGSD
jgi:hypothetical protein